MVRTVGRPERVSRLNRTILNCDTAQSRPTFVQVSVRSFNNRVGAFQSLSFLYRDGAAILTRQQSFHPVS